LLILLVGELLVFTNDIIRQKSLIIAREERVAVKADLLLTLFTPERIFAFATGPVETNPFAVRRTVCEL
jgi:hypothetical protein